MTTYEGILERVDVVLADGRKREFVDPDAAARWAALLNSGGESCRTVFIFTDGSTAEIVHQVEDGIVKTRVNTREWV